MAAAKRRRRDNGDGSVYQTCDGQWRATVELPRHPDGRRRRRTVTGPTKEAVKAKLKQLRDDQANGVDRAGAPRTVADLVTWWLDDHLPALEADGQVRPSTVVNYSTVARTHIAPHLGTVRLDQLGPEHLDRWLKVLAAKTTSKAGRPLSAATKRHAWNVATTLFKAAERRRWINRNPCSLVTGPAAGKPLQDDLTADQVKAMLAVASGERLEALAWVLLQLGLRLGEALALRWPAVDLGEAPSLSVEHTLQVLPGRGVTLGPPKNRLGYRTIPLPPAVADALRRHRKAQAAERLALGPAWSDEGWVFANPIGRAPDPSNVRKWWAGVAGAAGVGTTRTHAGRHTVATLLLEQGVPVEGVAAILGDVPATVANTYARVTDDAKRKAMMQLAAALAQAE